MELTMETTDTEPLPTVLAERRSRDGLVTWQARIGQDRGRLQIVGVVAPSTSPTIIEPLTDAELRELLTPAAVEGPETWTCDECGRVNDRQRRWCSACSSHGGAAR